MHASFFQRLILDRKFGFNYEYMGYAEYEIGVIKGAMTELARLFVAGELEGFVGQAQPFGCNPLQVCGFCEKGKVNVAVSFLKDFRNKGPFEVPATVAWMNIRFPLLLLRDPEFIPRVDLFLKPFVDGIRSERTASDCG